MEAVSSISNLRCHVVMERDPLNMRPRHIWDDNIKVEVREKNSRKFLD
jgi:hypothetical protein